MRNPTLTNRSVAEPAADIGQMSLAQRDRATGEGDLILLPGRGLFSKYAEPEISFALGVFHSVPKCIHFSEIAFLRCLALCRERGFNPLETTCELCVCGAQSRLGVQPQMTPQVRHDKQQITVFFLDLHLCQLILGLDQFTGLFDDFIKHLRRGGPVKPNPGRAFLQFQRAQQGGQADGHTVQRALLGLSRTLCGLDRFPIGGLLYSGFVTRPLAKHMRVAGNHFVANRAHNGIETKVPRFFAHRGVIDGLQQQIAQLPLKVWPILAGNGVGNFVSLFNRVGRNAVEILFDIPRAPRFGIAQASHDFQQARDTRITVVDQVFTHCSVPICRVTST